MNMNNIKVICFDFDDTLVPEFEYVKSGFNKVAEYIHKTCNLPLNTVFHKLLSLYDENKMNVFDKIIEYYDIKEEEISVTDLISIYKNHTPDIQFSKDIEDVLKYLKEKNYLLAIISDGYYVQQENKMLSVNAQKIFDEIILTDLLAENRKAWKPSKISFEKLKNDFNVNFDEIVYIGDNPVKDFYIKKFFPIVTIRLIRNGLYKNELYKENILEDFSINDIKDLLNIF